MRKILSLFIVVLLAVTTTFAATRKYETVPGDPTQTRIYTLDNGLKVYMSVNKEAPRIQTYIAVRVGGKNDPAQTTGLAHYFEHLMFKGTEKFGTSDYVKEKQLLDQIEAQFEEYRLLTDEEARKAKYKIIDSLSYEASKYSIPNEYDKMMSTIGARGTNAWTSYDETNYTEDIPSNEIERWAKIQVDRFANNVIRGFHTELETVYEEKNMSLTQDARKLYEAMNTALFKYHPYGSQTVLGTQDHLKNPSITTIKNYYRNWYVPNNMAVIMAGDFNPDEAIEIVDKYFGTLKPNPNIVKPTFKPEEPITSPIVSEVWGLEAENLQIGYRFGGARTSDPIMLSLIDGLMNNGMAGIMDVNVVQKQLMGRSFSGARTMSDYSMFMLGGTPKPGQTLEEARDILLAQIEELKKGNFSEELLKAVIDNYRLSQIQMVEYNQSRTRDLLRSFIDEVPWKDKVEQLDKMSKITKKDVVDFANKNFKNNYAIVYKRQGKDPNEKKMDKPTITPIETNRDKKSQFLAQIESEKTSPIDPVFVDFKKDMSVGKTKNGIEVLYKKNETIPTFSMNYYFDMGRNSDKKLAVATTYFDYLGTSKYTPEKIKEMFYNMACSFYVGAGSENISIGVSGLAENQEKAITLLEEILSDLQPDEEALALLKANMKKQRDDAKKNQNACFTALQNYATYGAKSPFTNVLGDDEIDALTAQELVDILKGLTSYEHSILYFGPQNEKEFVAQVSKLHKTAKKLKPVIKNSEFVQQITKENKVFIAPYDAAQIYFVQVQNRGEKFDKNRNPLNIMYNSYFGGGMSGIVFQEMREARGLAYTARATVGAPHDLDKNYVTTAFIATQNDKMAQAMAAFEDIINNMPTSEANFKINKENLLTSLRTGRTTKSAVMNRYMSNKKLNLTEDTNKALFEAIQNMTLEDVIKYQQQYVKDGKWTYAILGREADLDLVELEKYGPITRLTLEEIFGY